MRNESYITKIKIKMNNFIDYLIDLYYNDKIKNMKIKKNVNNETININKQIKKNAELERKELAKQLGLSSNASWKKIVKANDKLFNKKQYEML